MLAKDLRPNRLEALKTVAARFIKGRPNDRIGIVEYAGESFTKTPITSDKSIVLSALKSIEFNNIIEGGTAIGMGLAENNAGQIDPRIAAELSQEFGIKVYTIGMGTNGTALSPVSTNPNGSFVYDNVKVTIDEDLLKEIATKTNGKYFRATNNEKLSEIYAEIDKLERTDVEEFKYTSYEEKFRTFVLIAGLLLMIELLLKNTVFRSFV